VGQVNIDEKKNRIPVGRADTKRHWAHTVKSHHGKQRGSQACKSTDDGDDDDDDNGEEGLCEW